MKNALIIAPAFALFAGIAPSFAVETNLQIQLGTSGDIQRQIINYDCGKDTPLSVTYINAAPNFLAILPVEGEANEVIFASAISASGARYASGAWVWWTKGTDANLYDATLGDDADAILSCAEINNTP
jgi:membrane-bound inhibitor of C-type lysozyme